MKPSKLNLELKYLIEEWLQGRDTRSVSLLAKLAVFSSAKLYRLLKEENVVLGMQETIRILQTVATPKIACEMYMAHFPTELQVVTNHIHSMNKSGIVNTHNSKYFEYAMKNEDYNLILHLSWLAEGVDKIKIRKLVGHKADAYIEELLICDLIKQENDRIFINGDRSTMLTSTDNQEILKYASSTLNTLAKYDDGFLAYCSQSYVNEETVSKVKECLDECNQKISHLIYNDHDTGNIPVSFSLAFGKVQNGSVQNEV